MRTLFNYFLVLLFALLILASCKKDDETPAPEEKAPIAKAGNDATTTVGQKVELDGSGSNDPDGGQLTYAWAIKSKPEGSSATLVNANQAKAEITPDTQGAYVIELTVSNSKKTAKDEVVVNATSLPYSGCVSITESINAPTVWKKMAPAGMVDYCVKSDITVTSTLTIEPGVVIEFDDQKGIHINGGKIIAKGTEANKIIFTGKNKAKGAWKGIELSSADDDDNEMTFCEISYAGSSNHISGPKAGLSLRNNSKIKLTNSVIKENNGFGVWTLYGSFTHFEKNTFSNNTLAALAIKADMMGKLDKESKFVGGNGRDGIEVNGGSIEEESEQLWPAFNDGSKFFVLDNFTIYSGVKVQEGAVLEFLYDKGIVVSGKGAYFNAVGTENKKITFTGMDKTKGYWKGIEFTASDNAKNELVYCEVNYAGSSNHVGGHKAGVAARNNASFTIRNSSVNESNGYGIAMIYAKLEGFSQNSFSNNKNAAIRISADLMNMLDGESQFNNGNGMNGVEVSSGSINFTTEVTWPAFADGSKYFVNGDITIYSGVKVEEGAEFVFASEKFISVNSGGYLFARGTADKKIIFTGYQQDRGFWKGIEFSSTQSAKNELTYCEISYGGSSTHVSGFKANISIRNNAEISVFNSTIKESAGWGIVKSYASLLTDDARPNAISNNTLGDIKE